MAVFYKLFSIRQTALYCDYSYNVHVGVYFLRSLADVLRTNFMSSTINVQFVTKTCDLFSYLIVSSF